MLSCLLPYNLNPSISVIHTSQKDRPTLVFDLIELFRSQAVDRVVVGLIQKGQPLTMEKELLSESTRKLLAKTILERLNRYEVYRSEKIQFLKIVNSQVSEYASFIAGKKTIFKPYVAKW